MTANLKLSARFQFPMPTIRELVGSLNTAAFGRSGWRSGRYAWDTSETLHPRDARGAPLADGQVATVKRRTFLKESTLAAARIATAGALRAAEPAQIEARRQD